MQVAESMLAWCVVPPAGPSGQPQEALHVAPTPPPPGLWRPLDGPPLAALWALGFNIQTQWELGGTHRGKQLWVGLSQPILLSRGGQTYSGPSPTLPTPTVLTARV